MIDMLSAAVGVSLSPATLGLVFATGVATSVGPCVAPRYIALGAIVSGYRRPMIPTLVFVAGLVGALMALGFGAGLAGSVWRFSTLCYTLLAAALVVGGCVTLWDGAAHRGCSAAGCPSESGHEPIAHGRAPRRSLGAIFMLGAAGAFVVSPCCTPVVAAIAATSTAIGKPAIGVALLASFALGHSAPLFFAGSIATCVRRAFRDGVGQAGAIVAGVLMLALGAYYGVLA